MLTTTVYSPRLPAAIQEYYEDSLAPVGRQGEDHLRLFAVRYQYRIWGDWFVGAQASVPTMKSSGKPRLTMRLCRLWV